MVNAKLRIAIPEGIWLHDVSVAYPETLFHVIAVLPDDGKGVALIELQAPDRTPVISAIDDSDDVLELELLSERNGNLVMQVESGAPLLLDLASEAGVPLETPLEITDGTAIWTVTTSSARLSSLGTRLEEMDVEFEVEHVHEEPATGEDHLLTGRQREVLTAAVEQGYYDMPRRATLTEVSDSLGISKSTASGILHRAEEKAVRWYLDDYLAVGQSRLEKHGPG